MDNPTNTPEQQTETAPAAANAAAQTTSAEQTAQAAQAAPKTGNLADTDEQYKHKHGEHKHHHHHHRHRHHHFHFLNLTPSGIWSNLKLIAKTPYTYPYVLLLVSIAFLFFVETGKPLKILAANRGRFASPEDYFALQEFLAMHTGFLTRVPFQFTLIVAVVITAIIYYRAERHWQRNILKILPALGAAAVLSIPCDRGTKPPAEVSQSACRDSLRKYHVICIEYAEKHDGAFPERLTPEKPSPASKYGEDHFNYLGAGKKASDEAFILIEDKQENHIGNFRYAIRSDGVLLLSKYGRPYQTYLGKQPVDPK